MLLSKKNYQFYIDDNLRNLNISLFLVCHKISESGNFRSNTEWFTSKIIMCSCYYQHFSKTKYVRDEVVCTFGVCSEMYPVVSQCFPLTDNQLFSVLLLHYYILHNIHILPYSCVYTSTTLSLKLGITEVMLSVRAMIQRCSSTLGCYRPRDIDCLNCLNIAVRNRYIDLLKENISSKRHAFNPG